MCFKILFIAIFVFIIKFLSNADSPYFLRVDYDVRHQSR